MISASFQLFCMVLNASLGDEDNEVSNAFDSILKALIAIFEACIEISESTD